MKRRAFLGVAGSTLTATGALLPAQSREADENVGTSQRGTVESEVLELERKWLDATVRRDEPTLATLMSDDFTRVAQTSPNFAMTKAQWLGNTLRWYRIESFQLLSSRARVSGNTAVVASRYRWRGVLASAPLHDVVTTEDSWERRSGHWRVVRQLVTSTEKAGRQADQPAGPRKAIELDPAIYLAYVGRYEFGPSRILTISCEGGRLVHQGSGGQRAELYAETKERFFRKDSAALTIFERTDGQVTHVTRRHPNGRESIGKRIA